MTGLQAHIWLHVLLLKVMVTRDDFRKVLAETQVRNPVHLRLDTEFYYIQRDMQLHYNVYKEEHPLR